MKPLSKLILLVTVAFGLSTRSSHATTFDYSYAFGDGLVVSGSLDGTLDGLFVDDVSNVSVFFNGAAMPGTVYTAHFDGSAYLNGPIVSFDAFQNNFFFINSDVVGADFGFDSFFSIVNAAVLTDTATAQSFSLDLSGSQDFPTNGHAWLLTEASVADGGSTVALLGSAMISLVALRRRR